jgi:heat-inducible transcriptional repressor
MEERKRGILKAVVQEFTSSGVPVGSQALARRYFLNLSSATIRNELADLADLGYLVQPHTSAGRVPTDSGYRYFVDFLMDADRVPSQVQGFIEGEVRSAGADIQNLVERVAMTIAAVTQSAAVVSAPHGPTARIKHIDLVSLEPTEILLVMLVEGNLLRQLVVRLSRPARQPQLTRLAQQVNREFAGRSSGELAQRQATLREGLEKEVMGRIVEALGQVESGRETLVVHDGVRNLLRQPEFADAGRLQQVLEVLEETRHLAALLSELTRDSDLQIVIGSENPTSQLRSCTVVLTTYGPSAQVKGCWARWAPRG